MRSVAVVGAGLAGCEAALQCARSGVPVRLIEMRPGKMTEAHETGDVAELVCSNSLKSDEPENTHGLLKAELRFHGSVLLECAERARIPGGKALVVDRRRFSREVQKTIDSAGIEVTRQEVTALPQGIISRESDESRNLSGETPRIASLPRGDEVAHIMVIATGPLTSQAMADAMQSVFGVDRLFFYDAIAPIVSAESLDMTRVFEGSRYGAGSDYLNCPMAEEEYDRFVQALLEAELHPLHGFEKPRFFEGCLPVEEIARRGRLALAFGPMKPVGLVDPRTGKRPFAVVQLRRENAKAMYNLVGFQTRLKQGEQERVFGWYRAGAGRVPAVRQHPPKHIHRLAEVLLATLQTKSRPELLVAGQLTGVEGYVESIGAGLVAGINAARLAGGEESIYPPHETMLGSLLRYVTTPSDSFQPMNANFGLLPPLGQRLRGRDKRLALSERALEAARAFALTAAENRA